MECDIPGPHAAVRSRTCQFRLAHPEDSVNAASGGVLDRDIARRLVHTPDVYVCVQGSRSTVAAVLRPRQGQHSAAVERPS